METACCCNYKNCKICCIFVLDSSIPICVSLSVMFTCLNFLPCCLDNSHCLIGSQKSICRRSSTCLNYQATREIVGRYAKKLFAHVELSICLFVRLLWLKWKPAFDILIRYYWSLCLHVWKDLCENKFWMHQDRDERDVLIFSL